MYDATYHREIFSISETEKSLINHKVIVTYFNNNNKNNKINKNASVT